MGGEWRGWRRGKWSGGRERARGRVGVVHVVLSIENVMLDM